MMASLLSILGATGRAFDIRDERRRRERQQARLEEEFSLRKREREEKARLNQADEQAAQMIAQAMTSENPIRSLQSLQLPPGVSSKVRLSIPQLIRQIQANIQADEERKLRMESYQNAIQRNKTQQEQESLKSLYATAPEVAARQEYRQRAPGLPFEEQIQFAQGLGEKIKTATKPNRPKAPDINMRLSMLKRFSEIFKERERANISKYASGDPELIDPETMHAIEAKSLDDARKMWEAMIPDVPVPQITLEALKTEGQRQEAGQQTQGLGAGHSPLVSPTWMAPGDLGAQKPAASALPTAPPAQPPRAPLPPAGGTTGAGLTPQQTPEIQPTLQDTIDTVREAQQQNPGVPIDRLLDTVPVLDPQIRQQVKQALQGSPLPATAGAL